MEGLRRLYRSSKGGSFIVLCVGSLILFIYISAPLVWSFCVIFGWFFIVKGIGVTFFATLYTLSLTKSIAYYLASRFFELRSQNISSIFQFSLFFSYLSLVIGLYSFWIAISFQAINFIIQLSRFIALHIYSKRVKVKYNDVNFSFGVSRRFTNEELNDIYWNIIAPIVEKRGVLVESSFASDREGSINFWQRRMNLIFSVCDIHLIVDIDRTPATYYENLISYSLSRMNRKNKTRGGLAFSVIAGFFNAIIENDGLDKLNAKDTIHKLIDPDSSTSIFSTKGTLSLDSPTRIIITDKRFPIVFMNRHGAKEFFIKYDKNNIDKFTNDLSKTLDLALASHTAQSIKYNYGRVKHSIDEIKDGIEFRRQLAFFFKENQTVLEEVVEKHSSPLDDFLNASNNLERLKLDLLVEDLSFTDYMSRYIPIIQESSLLFNFMRNSLKDGDDFIKVLDFLIYYGASIQYVMIKIGIMKTIK